MSNRIRNTLLVIGSMLLLTCLVASVRGNIILQDDFTGTNGNPPDGAKWADRVNVTLDGSGFAVMGAPAHLQAQTSSNFAPTTTLAGQETIAFGNGNGAIIMGLSGPGLTGTSANILLRTDEASLPENGFWEIQIVNSGNVGRFFTPIGEGQATGIWQLDWYTSKVTLSFNGTLVFDSDVNAPQYGVGAWSSVLPIGVALHPDFGGRNYTLDSVTWEGVPEPSSLLLGGFGSMSLLVRREQKRCHH